MEVGRRYLAPVARDHGGWYPFTSTLLRLRGKLVVGGVDAGGSPGRRWQRADADHYRLWGDPKSVPVIVASGVTPRSRWQLYLRLPARGGMCVGMSVRALWHPNPAPSGEGCGGRTLRPLKTGLALFFAHRRGMFAFGHTGSRVYAVRVRFGDQEWKEADTTYTPDPPGGSGRFWVVPADGDGFCRKVTVQAIGPKGTVVDEHRVGRHAAC